MSPSTPLPSGLVAFVKRDCPTCELVVPVLEQISARESLTVYTQDDPAFPPGIPAVDDTSLEQSWHHQIETVPTLIRVEDGEEHERVLGWVRFSGSKLHARRVELAELEDEMEAMYARGWSDGLPMVPPTEKRVLEMLEGTTRAPDDAVAIVPPDLVECNVEKVAINAVMAGCKPEYLPVVLAAVEAACTDRFNMHGVIATTMGVGPIVVVNGPIRRAIGMNSGMNVMGQGNRANATIGRALQLVVQNVGGGRPGEVDRATYGNPGKLGFCFAEDEESSPWGPLSADLGAEPGTSTVTVFAGEGPRNVIDQRSREPVSLARSLAAALRTVQHPKLAIGYDAMLVIGPEHARVLKDAGWSKKQLIEELTELLTIPGEEMMRGVDEIAEGMPESFRSQRVTKFRPGGLLVVHCGGSAGLFSAILGGWASGPKGSRPAVQEVRP